MNLPVFIMLTALFAPAAALAATDNEKFEKLLGKATITDLDDIQKATAACVCREAAFNAKAGVLGRTFGGGQWFVICLIPTFDTAGSATTNPVQPCVDWELLTK
jgi:hypothetical protein